MLKLNSQFGNIPNVKPRQIQLHTLIAFPSEIYYSDKRKILIDRDEQNDKTFTGPIRNACYFIE